MKLTELEVFNLAMDLGEMVWKEVLAWDYFAKSTLGKQIVNSADSVAANIADGFGRFHYQENKHFCYISRGSLTETQVWLKKAENRNLITIDALQIYYNKIELLHKKLNAYIKSIGSKNITNK